MQRRPVKAMTLVSNCSRYVCEEDPKNPQRLHIIKERGFTRRPIVQLAAVEELSLCLALSDGVLSAIHLTTLESITVVVPGKASNFHVARRQDSGAVVLCTAVGEGVEVQQWGREERKFLPVRQVKMGAAIRAMVWLDGSLCVGLPGSYSIVDLASGNVDKVFNTGTTGAVLLATTGAVPPPPHTNPLQR